MHLRLRSAHWAFALKSSRAEHHPGGASKTRAYSCRIIEGTSDRCLCYRDTMRWSKIESAYSMFSYIACSKHIAVSSHEEFWKLRRILTNDILCPLRLDLRSKSRCFVIMSPWGMEMWKWRVSSNDSHKHFASSRDHNWSLEKVTFIMIAEPEHTSVLLTLF